MRFDSVMLCGVLLASGCSETPTSPVESKPESNERADTTHVDRRTPDQVAAQAELEHMAQRDAERAYEERQRLIVEKLKDIEPMERYLATSKALLKQQADGKITAEQHKRLKRALEDSVLNGTF